MLLEIKNIGKIHDQTFMLKEINIIAGKNDTSKSSVGKIIFSLFSANSMRSKSENIDKIKLLLVHDILTEYNIEELKIIFNELNISSNIALENTLLDYLSNDTNIKILLDKLQENKRFNFYKNILLNDDCFNSLIVENTLKHQFNGLFKNAYTNENSLIRASFNDKVTEFTEVNYDEYHYQSNNKATKVVYLDSLSSKITTEYMEFIKSKEKNNEQVNIYLQYLEHTLYIVNSNFQVNQKIYRKEINEILTEFESLFSFEKINNGYFEDDGVKIPFSSQASGTKNLYFLYRLIKSGYLDENTILIIDEPEDELHPDWQFSLSKILFKINNLLGSKILITTHSSEQIESLVSLISYEKRPQCLNLFLSQKEKNKITFSEHQNNPEHIYNSLNSVYEKIDELDEQ